MKKIIGIILILIFLGLGISNYFANENFKELSNAIITIIGLVQAFEFIFDKSDKKIDEINEKTSMILKILENDEE